MVDLIGSLDWPTPASALLQEAGRGGATLGIDYDTLDMPGHKLREYLDRQGIPTWGYSVYDGQVLLSYRKADEARLLDALCRPGGLHAPNALLASLLHIALHMWLLGTAALLLLAGEMVWGKSLLPAVALFGVGLLTGGVGLSLGAMLYGIWSIFGEALLQGGVW